MTSDDRHTARLLNHPALGRSFEGFALNLVVDARPTRDVYFWSVHAGPELDLLAFVSGRRVGFEFKYSDAPPLTTSMQQAAEHLRLDALYVVYPGTRRYTLAPRVEAMPLGEAVELARAPLMKDTSAAVKAFISRRGRTIGQCSGFLVQRAKSNRGPQSLGCPFRLCSQRER